MSREDSRRADIIAALFKQMRVSSANGVLLSHSIAERVGLNATDMESLDLMSQEGSVTAGRLAELTGLTTSAVTGVIDRLEKAGYARRRPNPRDRRSILVEPLADQVKQTIDPYFVTISRAGEEVCSRYSDAELTLLLDFITRLNVKSLEAITGLRNEHRE